MTLAYWMVLTAALLPYLCVGLAKAKPGFDNAAPRDWLANLRGWRARAEWAHRNHFEAFPAFAAAVIVAELKHAPQHRTDMLAVAFVLLRLIYTACYIGDVAWLRSLVWFCGIGCMVALFVGG